MDGRTKPAASQEKDAFLAVRFLRAKMNALLSKILLSAFFLAGIIGCSTKDLSDQPGSRTDYIIGQTYELKAPGFLHKLIPDDTNEIPRINPLGTAGTPSTETDFEAREWKNTQVIGLLRPGTRLKITKFAEDSNLTIGIFFKVYAKIVSGEHKGQIVELSMISKSRGPAYNAFVDPEYLAKVK